MAYCDHSDVTGKTGFTYSGSSQPTRDEVETICAEISLEIDAALRAVGYTTLPVTGDNDLALVARYAKLGAAYNAWLAGVDQADVSANAEIWRKDYLAFLERIAKGDQALPDQQPAGAEPGGMASVALTRQDGFALRAAQTELGQ